MKKLLKCIQEEHNDLTCQIEEIRIRLSYLKESQQQKLQLNKVLNPVPEPIYSQVVNTESSKVSQTAANSEDILLVKVDDVLARATMVMKNNGTSKTKIPQRIQNRKKKLENTGQQENAAARPSKNNLNSNIKHQVPPVKGPCPSTNEATLDNDDLVGKRRRRLQSKYFKIARVLDSLSSSKINFHDKLAYPLDSATADASFQELPELNCIHKILRHILDSYIMPGNYSTENIELITRKTDEQLSTVTENLYSYQSLKVAQSLFACGYQSANFLEKSVQDRLQVVAFSKSQQITKCLTNHGKISMARMHLKLLEELCDIAKSKPLKDDAKMVQLSEFILSEKMFIPPVRLQK